MNKPHIHKDCIIAWANGAIIQVQDEAIKTWSACPITPQRYIWANCRVKPEVIRYKRWLTQGKRIAICHEEQFRDPVKLSHFHSWIDIEWQEIEVPQ